MNAAIDARASRFAAGLVLAADASCGHGMPGVAGSLQTRFTIPGIEHGQDQARGGSGHKAALAGDLTVGCVMASWPKAPSTEYLAIMPLKASPPYRIMVVIYFLLS